MRTEPSFSAKSEELASEDSFDNQEELNLPDEPNFASEAVDEPQHLVDYRRRYGLSMDPFADDQHFPLYTGGQRRQILDQLLHVCQFSNNLLVVLGGYSVGKTRMAQALIDSLDDADDICFLEGQVTSSFDSLMEGVLAQFELPDAETFHEFVKKQSESDGLAVLIVDKNSPYQKPQDLKGKQVALPDQHTLGAMLGNEFFRPPATSASGPRS